MTLNGNGQHSLKTLLIDLLMGLLFVLLIAFSAWLLWIYYVRGPIDIVTTKDTLRTEQDILAQARDEYTTHFHNLDQVVLAGNPTKSMCLDCHGDYPHMESEKMRALLNAHSWFMACEVCHLKHDDGDQVAYRWLDNQTGEELNRLRGEIGNYGGAIVPVQKGAETLVRLDKSADRDKVSVYIETRDQISDAVWEKALRLVHEAMVEEPISCDGCHTSEGLFDFKDLLYPSKKAEYLESIDMGAMVDAYEEFHLPDLSRHKVDLIDSGN